MAVVPHFAVDRATDAAGQDVLAVSGDVDLATAHELVAAADACLGSGAQGPLRLDLSDVAFIDSTGISALLEVRRAAADAGIEVVTVGQSAIVDRVLAIAGITDLFGARAGGA